MDPDAVAGHAPALPRPSTFTLAMGEGSVNQPAKLWGGRFSRPTDQAVEAYTSSIEVDRRLVREDIAGSIAHARMLARQGIIPGEEAERIIAGLEAVLGEVERGEYVFDPAHEDVHLNVEARLTALIGPEAAGKLHTARSRNDQVALDLRLFTLRAIDDTVAAIRRLQGVLLDLAEQHVDDVLPGYTHLQRAQPVVLAHHLHAYVEMLERDAGRFRDAAARAAVSPLGAGALAGVPYPLAPEAVAQELGLPAVTENSLDAVSDRDFIVEYEAAAAICMMHLSRLAEEIVLWSTPEFGFLTLDDAFTTGSSIMPQKKNPDVAELARAKTGRVYGNLMAILTVLKALPLAYNRDLQEDKPGFFDTVDTLLATLDVMMRMLPAITFHTDRMRAVARANYALATDVADYLVRKGMPFRQAHHVVGALVSYALRQGKELHELTPAEYRQFSPLFDEDVRAIDLTDSVNARDVPGGTAPRRVRAALARARARLRRHLEAETS
jgi:argininosuccinate lyase